MEIANRALPVPRDRGFPRALATGAGALYAATVAVQLGGSWREALAAAVVGLAGGGLHGAALARPRVDFGKSLAAAWLATMGALLLCPALRPHDLERALFGGLAVLAPVALVTVGAGEIASGNAEAGFSKLARACLRVLALATGSAAAWAIAGRWAPPLPEGTLPVLSAPVTLPPPVLASLLVIGGLALTVCLQARWRDASWMIAGVLVAHATQTLTSLPFLPEGCAFLSSFGLAAVALLQSRATRRAPSLMIVPGLVQLATSFIGMQLLVSFADAGAARSAFLQALFVAAQLAGGLLFAEAAFGRRRNPRAA